MTTLTPVGSGNNAAVAFNADRVVVGYEVHGPDRTYEPVVWRAGTGTILPVPVGMTGGTARAINRRGDVVGAVTDGQGVRHGFSWDGITMTLLAGLAPGRTVIAQAINDSGQIAGVGATADGHDVALRWSSPTARPTILGPVAPDNYAFGWAIAADGTVGGSSDLMDTANETDVPHAALWTSGHVRVLDALSGPGGQGQILAMNNAGQAVGTSVTAGTIPDPSHPSHATLWDGQGHPHDLGTLSGDDFSQGEALSSNGYVVGSSGAFDYPDASQLTSRAFIWSATGGMRALPLPHLDPMSVNSEANAVDDKGTVAGFVTPNGESRRAVLWTCVV
jgi:probable HAF family extracellular repeat protein